MKICKNTLISMGISKVAKYFWHRTGPFNRVSDEKTVNMMPTLGEGGGGGAVTNYFIIIHSTFFFRNLDPVAIGKYVTNVLMYVDDLVLMSASKEGLQEMSR